MTNLNTPSLAVRYLTVPEVRAATEARSSKVGKRSAVPESADGPGAQEQTESPDM